MPSRPTIGLRAEGALFDALGAPTAGECAKHLEPVAMRFHVFGEAMPNALRGEWGAVTVLVTSWHGLVSDVLETAFAAMPDLVRRLDDHFGILTASNVVSPDPVHYLDHLIGEAPFSPLLACFGEEVGIGVVAIHALRDLLPGRRPLQLETSCGWRDLPEGADRVRYQRLVDMALRSLEPPLVRVRELFNLTNAELGELFGVKRQAVDQWEQTGDVPSARSQKLLDLLAVGELLNRKLKPGRLPLVARKRAADYGGNTMLDMVRADRSAELRALTERAFDWSVTA